MEMFFVSILGLLLMAINYILIKYVKLIMVQLIPTIVLGLLFFSALVIVIRETEYIQSVFGSFGGAVAITATILIGGWSERLINMKIDIKKIREFVKSKLDKEPTGHDYKHACRVGKNAIDISKNYEVNIDVVIVSCLIHDLIDRKLEVKYKVSLEEIEELLLSCGFDKEVASHIIHIITNISYSNKTKPSTKEGLIVQDADRLDALGAIGIARTFAYGGNNNRQIYSENLQHGEDSFSHFYDKLFKLKDLMNTEEGKLIAVERTKFMEEFINRFKTEVT